MLDCDPENFKFVLKSDYPELLKLGLTASCVQAEYGGALGTEKNVTRDIASLKSGLGCTLLSQGNNIHPHTTHR